MNDTLNVPCATTVNSTMFKGYVGSYALEVWSLYDFHDALVRWCIAWMMQTLMWMILIYMLPAIWYIPRH